MVAIVIAVPQSVTYFLDKPSNVDPSKVKIEIQAPPQRGRRCPRLQVALRWDRATPWRLMAHSSLSGEVVGAKGWHSRGYLPHFDSQDSVQFVTFRLSDSLPAQVAAQLSIGNRPQSSTEEVLDRCLGACWLRRPEIARLVEEALLVFDGQRYRLLAWTIMPNHVHVLISTMPSAPLGQIVGSWKRFTAREANIVLRRTGAFWQVDYRDRFIRNDEHFDVVVNYIDLNPVKAGLVQEPHLWPWGSARFKKS